MTQVATEKETKKVFREIEEFHKKYADAIEAARISERHTSTEGWRSLYSINRAAVEDSRKKLGQHLEESARVMKRGGMDEDYEKQLGEIKKASAELRAEISAFQRQTIAPVENPVAECHRVIEEARYAARNGEAQSPLTHRGLSVAMDEAIDTVDKATFDAESGTVNVISPSGEVSE